MKKLIIQIPCYNEEATLYVTLSELPRKVQGVDVVEWLIIDDGSTDRTLEVAKEIGVDHIVRHTSNQGLAKAFMSGIEASLKAGADVIVNTDADNQYSAEYIPKLIEPILAGKAEIVVGARPIDDIEEFSYMKKRLQKIGSWVVRLVSKSNIPDAPSGFRAMSRNAASQLNVFNEYTYTLETIIQAGQKNIAIASVPVKTNKYLRPSRLVKSIPSYVQRSLLTIIRIFMTYRPFLFFTVPGVIAFTCGFLIGLRFLYFYLTGNGGGHVQSLILGAIFLGMGVFLSVVGLLADLISVNRKLLENINWRVQKMEMERNQNEHIHNKTKSSVTQ